MKEHYAFFDFDEDRFLVRYYSDNNICDEIEDAFSSICENEDDSDYEEIVKDVMDSFNVKWEFLPVRRYWI